MMIEGTDARVYTKPQNTLYLTFLCQSHPESLHLSVPWPSVWTFQRQIAQGMKKEEEEEEEEEEERWSEKRGG